MGRVLQKPPITQEDLAKKLQFMGMEDMTPLIISRIEKNQRHVCDAELRMIAKALEVTICDPEPSFISEAYNTIL